MLNYFRLIKDLQYIDDEKQSAIVADMASTEHDTYRIGDFFRLLKRDHEILYKKDQLYFRLIITDYSWAFIHRIIQGLNIESIEQYMARFYDLSLGLIKTDDSKKSWLCSCVAHTMNLFAYSVKINKEIPKRLESFIWFLIGLLLNSLDLESMLPIYQMICYVFLSSNINRYNISALEAIEELINTRPHEKETIQKICNELFERNDDDVDSESRVN